MYTAKHELTAEDVSYDNSAGLFPPTVTDVQQALDNLAGGGGGAGPMEPLVLGTAFGRQVINSAPNNSNCLGWQVDDSQGGCTVLYNDESGAAQSVFTKDSSISITNTCNPDPTSMLNGSIHVMNDVGFINPPTIAPGSVIVASNARYDTQVSSNDCIAIGTGGVGATIDLNASACAITNGLTAETLAAREFCCSDFTSFRLRALPAGTGNAVVYDPVTSLITDSGAPPGGALAAPTVAGSIFGDVLGAPTTQLSLGYNVFSPAVASGINLYSSAISAPQTEHNAAEDCIYISTSSQANTLYTGSIALHLATNLTQSLPFSVSMIAGSPGFAMPVRASLLLSPYAPNFGTAGGGIEKEGCIALSSGITIGVVNVNDNSISLSNSLAGHTCAVGELYIGSIAKWTLAGSLPTASTAASNLFLRRDPATGEIAAGPLAPVLATVDTNDQILTRDSISGLVSYNTAIKRTLSYSLNTDGSGQVTQNYSGLSLAGAPQATVTVNNNSTTVAYTCNIIGLNATDITIQVFSFTNPGPVLATVGAGITVGIILSF